MSFITHTLVVTAVVHLKPRQRRLKMKCVNCIRHAQPASGLKLRVLTRWTHSARHAALVVTALPSYRKWCTLYPSSVDFIGTINSRRYLFTKSWAKIFDVYVVVNDVKT